MQARRVSARLGALLIASVCAGAAFTGSPALAGNQRYEPLSDSVRTVLARAIADEQDLPRAQFATAKERVDWLAAMSVRLPKKHQPTYRERMDFLHAVHYEATRAGLDPQLVLAVIQVESNFRRYAISSAGARGYMQVMPFWADLIGNSDAARLFDMRTNLRFGCTILRYYLQREKGNLFRALGRYNGSLGKAKYPNKVLKALKRWKYPA